MNSSEVISVHQAESNMLPEDESQNADQTPEEPSPEPSVEVAATPAPAADSPAASDPNDKKQWYIVKVQSGREDTIKGAIERRVKIEQLEEFFGQIIVPVEKVTEISKGKRVVRSKKMFPGYIIANVEFNDRILYLFRETSGVGDFVGAGPHRAPAPMPQHEIDKILLKMLPKEQAMEQVKVKFDFEKGDKVRVRDGTFVGMEGEVKEIIEPKDSKETPRVRVELTIFGRPVPVEVEAWQVETA